VSSLAERIRAEIEANILSGAWPPGHRIPFEHELTARYGCARMTVSGVLSRLAEDGLIERRRRAGSFVAAPKAQSAVLEIPDLRAELQARGAAYGYELVSQRRRRAARADEAGRGMAVGTPLLDLTCLHRANGRAIAHEARLISLAAVPAADAVDFAAVPPGSWLLEHVPWTEAEHRISAAAADEGLARHLEIALGGACLVMARRTWRAGATVTDVRQSFVAGSFDLVARFGAR
jgi:histidine utilization repressor